MSLQIIQDQVDHRIKTIGVAYFDPLTNLGQLVEEVGEIARIMTRTYGQQSWKPGKEQADLGAELVDLLFVVTCLANQTGVNLEDAWQASMKKRTDRDATRHKNNEKLKKE